MRMPFFLTVAAALSVAAPAFADEGGAHADAHADTSTAARRPGPLTLRVGGSFIAARHQETSLDRGELSIGLGLDVGRYVMVYADIRPGTTWISYRGSLDDNLRVNTQLWSYLDVAAATGLVVHAVHQEHWELDFFGEVSGSVGHMSPALRQFDITTPQGTYDVMPYAQSNTNLRFSWYQVGLGPTIRGTWGWFSPSLTVGFEYLHATLDTGLNDDSRDVVTKLGYDANRIERTHEISSFHVLLAPAAAFLVDRQNALEVRVLLAPGGESWSYGGALGYLHRF